MAKGAVQNGDDRGIWHRHNYPPPPNLLPLPGRKVRVAMAVFDLLTLRLLLTIKETGSVAKAAEKAHLTPSAVSKRILELERTIGVALLERRAHGSELTAAGVVAAVRAADVLSNLHLLRIDLAEFVSGAAGVVRVASNTSGIAGGLPADIAAFRRTFPKVEIVLTEMTSAHVLDVVAAGQADIGVASAKWMTADLRCVAYRSTPLVLAVPPDHALANRERIHYDETRKFAHIGHPPDSALGALIPKGPHNESGVFSSVTSFAAMLALVCAGIGVAVIPLTFVLANAVDGLRLISLDDAWARFDLALISDAANIPSPAAAALYRFLAESKPPV